MQVSDFLLGLPTEQEINGMTNCRETLLTPDHSGQYSPAWEDWEGDPPWSPYDVSSGPPMMLTQRPRAIPGPEETLYVPDISFPVNHLSPPPQYPSQISSPLSIASGPANEMPPLNSAPHWPMTLQNYTEGGFSDTNIPFYDNQNSTHTKVVLQTNGDGGQPQPFIFTGPPSPYNAPLSPMAVSRSPHVMSGDLTLPDWPLPVNEELSNDVGRPMNYSLFNSQRTLQDQGNQFGPNSEPEDPKTSIDPKWDHTILSKGTMRRIHGQTPSKEEERKKGRRTGPLSADKAKKVGEVRHNRACWRCWYYKTTVRTRSNLICRFNN
jgi:hypothetical protein